MKNKTYLKASFREITQSKGRFIAIILIILLGTSLYVGVKSAGPILNHSASQYVDQHHLADLQIVSTMGITETDKKLAETIPGVQVETAKQLYYANQAKNEVLELFSYTKKMTQNQLILKKGHLPQKENEIVLDSQAEKKGYQLGENYRIDDQDQLTQQIYKIVGFVDSPLFISTTERGAANVGSGTVSYFGYIPEANFKTEVDAVLYIQFDNVKDEDTYSQSYKTQMAKNQTTAEKIFAQRPQQRLTEIQEEAEQKLTPAKASVNEGLTTINEAQIKLIQARQQVAQQKERALSLPQEQQNTVLNQLITTEAALEKEQTEIDKNKQQLDASQQKIAENQQTINAMNAPTYLFNLRSDNPGFQEYGDLSDRIAAIANVFPVFFFFIAALITFTTMTRMVEENRREIGTLKALGYAKTEIAKKYIIYALLAAIIGIVGGTVAGTEALPRIIYTLSSERYTLGGVKIYYVIQPIIQAGFAFLLATVGSALVVLLRELRDKPAELLQARAPKPGKRIFLEYMIPLWSRLNFNQKVSYRNIFRYKSRMIMAIIGISGCAGLMVAGFGLKDSLGSVAEKQFGPIIDYQAIVTLAEKDTAEAQVTTQLDQTKQVANYATIYNETIESRKKGKAAQNLTLMVPANQTVLNKYVHLTTTEGKQIKLPSQGAVITEKIAELHQLKQGETVTFYDQEQKPIKVKITAIVKNYLGNFVYLSKEYYEEQTQQSFQSNALLVKTRKMSNKQETTLAKNLLSTGDVTNTTFMSTQIQAQKDSMANLNAIVIIFVVLSGALAFVVLYNLITINVSERMRELSTIKVLGFYDKEVTMYIVRENILFTLVGILFGYGIGYILTDFILQQASMDNVIFPLVINWPAYVVSGGLTLFFTLVVMLVTHLKLKHINMMDALKANE